MVCYVAVGFGGRRVRVIRVDNWFGSRWLHFAYNLRGASVWKPPSELRVPPFDPNRIASEVVWDRTPAGWLSVDHGRLHVPQRGASNRTRFAHVEALDESLIWFSGATISNKRGSLMAYLPSPKAYQTWHVEFEDRPGWTVSRVTGTSRAEFDRLLAAALA